MSHLPVVAALLSAVWFAPALQALPQHQHEHVATTVPATAPTARWTPDAPLRTGIRRAQQAVDALQRAAAGHMSAAMTRDRAVAVQQAVTFMFANCKLSAEPDAALHGILVPLLTAAQALQANPDNLTPVADMRAALAHYPQYFDDPGWDQPAAADAADKL